MSPSKLRWYVTDYCNYMRAYRTAGIKFITTLCGTEYFTVFDNCYNIPLFQYQLAYSSK